MSIHNEGPSPENALDREIQSAIKLGVIQPHADFTHDLMSMVAEEEAQPMITENPGRLPIMLIGLGFAFLVIAFLLPGSATGSHIMSASRSTLWTIAALGFIASLVLVQSKPKFR